MFISWQLVFLLWLLSTTAATLYYRKLAVTSKLSPFTSGAVRSFTVSLPFIAIIALISGDLVWPGYKIVAISALEALIGTIYGYTSFNAIKKLDSSTFSTLIQLKTIPVVLLSGVLLGEWLSIKQLLGAVLIMSSSLLFAKVKLSKDGLSSLAISLVLMVAISLLARYLVEATNVVTTLMFSASFSSIYKAIISRKELASSRAQIKKEWPLIFKLSIFSAPQVFLILWAIDLADNLALVTALSTVKTITVALAAALFLNERANLRLKLLSASLAAAGSLCM